MAPQLKTVFDVGGNTGEWSHRIRSVNRTARIHLFECNPNLMQSLHKKFDSDPAVVLHECALGDKEDRKIFYTVESSSELGSLVRPIGKEQYREGGQVSVRTVDAFCSELAIDGIDLLKVDTEGYDFHVLRGASAMISSQRIKVIQFEYGNGWARAGSTLLQCLDWLAERKYTTYLLTADGHQPFNYARWGEFLGYSNFVALSPHAVLD